MNVNNRYEYTVTQTDQELLEILELQSANRPEQLSPQELQAQGFVTARHDIETLRQMHQVYPHVIAKHNDHVIGYALCMMKSAETLVPALSGLFRIIESIPYQEGKTFSNIPLTTTTTTTTNTSGDVFRYFVMGQVCVNKEFRGKGIFQGLYRHMRKIMSIHFQGIVTAISPKNPRSIKAHAKVGFETIHQYTVNGEDWNLVLWDWTRNDNDTITTTTTTTIL